jgi:hypothetical protein
MRPSRTRQMLIPGRLTVRPDGGTPKISPCCVPLAVQDGLNQLSAETSASSRPRTGRDALRHAVVVTCHEWSFRGRHDKIDLPAPKSASAVRTRTRSSLPPRSWVTQGNARRSQSAGQAEVLPMSGQATQALHTPAWSHRLVLWPPGLQSAGHLHASASCSRHGCGVMLATSGPVSRASGGVESSSC